MSGGSMNYLYILVRDAEFHTHSPERKAFREHLMLVANALRAIEWNDSGDGDDQEVHNIMACISLSVSENDMLRAENARLRADVPVYSSEIERLREEMPVAESLRVDAKCAEIERDEARAAVWKQAKEIADLRAEVERLREALSWYADQRNHFPVERRNPGDPDPAVIFLEEPPIMSDGGKRARNALWAKP